MFVAGSVIKVIDQDIGEIAQDSLPELVASYGRGGRHIRQKDSVCCKSIGNIVDTIDEIVPILPLQTVTTTMTTADMRLPTSSFRSITPQFAASLKTFQASSAKFRILRTINASRNSPPSPKTLFILDSSFNPPSKAHLTLAKSALHTTQTAKHSGPVRLLLLFSTHNADKAPSAASFPQRLALMTVFAEDLIANLQASDSPSNDYTIPAIDIGVTTAPYYTDKTAAINSEGADTYPDEPTHLHILGFDTLTRIFAAKYYPDFDPPFSSLDPYFDRGHQLRVTLRPSDEYGTVQEQQAFLAKLRDGGMEDQGGKRSWAKQIQMVEAADGEGVSSTKVRKAANAAEWDEVRRLCTPSVARAVEEEGVYESDSRGAKMA